MNNIKKEQKNLKYISELEKLENILFPTFQKVVQEDKNKKVSTYLSSKKKINIEIMNY